MIPMKKPSNICVFDDCDKRSSFNFENKKKALYCSKHKLNDMINVKDKRCLNCDKQPIYNYKNEKNGLYCNQHKLPDMIDVKNKRCLDCDKQPFYNYKNEKIALYCNQHKLPNMINIKNKHCLNCVKQPNYNYQNEKTALYCNEHKLDDMINIKNKRCLTLLCDTFISNKNYKGYCFRCFIYTFPNNKIVKNYLTKERHITDYIKEQIEFQELNITYNKTISNACSRRRPDVLIEMYTHVIIIEIDENQHNDYNTTCEESRINELFTDLGDRNIIFIRFNPDKYIENNVKYQSCFKITKTTGLLIPIKNLLDERLKVLIDTIKENLKQIPKNKITTIKLYYDN